MSGRAPDRGRPVLVVGGAGFIGTNLVARLVADGRRVRIVDSLARPGSEANLAWLRETCGDALEIELGDVREPDVLRRAVDGVAAVYHLAAQVAVTTSLVDPLLDFEVNLRGTLNVLEAVRRQPAPPPVVFTSTNKVYGHLGGVTFVEEDGRWRPADPGLAARGIDESAPLDFASPYGCSKGGADQYVLDYGRSFGLRTVVARMSCIYGAHQHGNEDQGWVAHFALRAMEREPVTIYGDGKQVRDILWAEDLVDALLLAVARIDDVHGRAYNLGGGPGNAVSLHDVLHELGELGGEPVQVTYADWRAADQRYYVTNPGRFARATGWRPQMRWRDGVRAMYEWLAAARGPARRLAARDGGAAVEARLP